MVGRRTLRFNSLDDVMPEVDRLLGGGHQTIGKWSLGQICNHLTGAVELSMARVDVASFAPWPVQATVGKVLKRLVLGRGRLPDGVKLPEKYEPLAGLDARTEVDALRAALRSFAEHPGPFGSHPMFGLLRREEWSRFHTIHAAHHLGFAIPQGPTDG